MKSFYSDDFIKVNSKRLSEIETSDIALWIDCSVRYIQRLASELDIPYKRVHGRKVYIWNEESLDNLSTRLFMGNKYKS